MVAVTREAVANDRAGRRWARWKRPLAGSLLATGLLVGASTLPAGASTGSIARTHRAPASSHFYRGKTVEILVPNAPGGGIDVTARVAVPYLQRALGAAGVKVVDVTGAGGITGLDQLWNGPHDGLTIGYTNLPVPLLTVMVGGAGIDYRAKGFTYLGRVTAGARVVVVSPQSHITSPEQLRGAKVKVPLSGFDDSFYTVAALAHSLGFTPEYVSGFASLAAALDSLATGSTELMEGSLASLLPSIQAHLVVPIMFENVATVPAKYKGLAVWPSLSWAKYPKLVSAFTNLVSIEGTYIAPPGTPKAAIDAFRSAVGKMFSNPQFKAAEIKAGTSLDYLDGRDEQSAILKLVADMEPYVPMLRADLKAASS